MDAAEWIIVEFTTIQLAYITAAFGGTSAYISGLLITMIKISLVLMALMWVLRINTPDPKEFMAFYTKAIAVIIVTSSWEYYRYLVDFFVVFPGEIAASVVSSVGIVGDIDNINQLLGLFIKSGIEAAGLAFSQMSLALGIVVGIIIIVSTIVSALGLLVAIVLSSILLGVLLGLGPVFISAKIFGVWNKTFDMWIQQTANVALVPTFGYAIAAFTLPVAQRSMDEMTVEMSLGYAIIVAFVGFINWIALKKVYEITAAITGGFALTDEWRARRAAYDGAKSSAANVGGSAKRFFSKRGSASSV